MITFVTKTSVLNTATQIGVVNSNVNKLYSKSTVVQLTATTTSLRINVEADTILTQILIPGEGIGNEQSIMVDAVLFRKLIATLHSEELTMDFHDDCLKIKSGSSEFNLPQILDSNEVYLSSPYQPTPLELENATMVDKTKWKFIKDHQMFAKADSYTNPVYRYVWVGKDGDVIVGDYVNSIFTHSKYGKIGNTCLLTDTVINLLCTIPDGAKIVQHEESYVIELYADDFVYTSEFLPKYESEEFGDYNSEIIINMMDVSGKPVSKIKVADIMTILNQSDLLSSSRDPKLYCTVSEDCVTFTDANINCEIPITDGPSNSYSLCFTPSLLKSVISNLSEGVVGISPVENSGDIVGITFTSGDLTIVLAGRES